MSFSTSELKEQPFYDTGIFNEPALSNIPFDVTYLSAKWTED